jgi:hypothetical protein
MTRNRLLPAFCVLAVAALAPAATAGATTIAFGDALTKAGIRVPGAVTLPARVVRLTAGRRSATLSDLRLAQRVRAQVTGRIDGGSRRTLFTVSGSTLVLTGDGARALSRRLDVRLRPGASAGRLALDPTTRTITAGTITWGYDTALRGAFQSAFPPLVSGGVAQNPDGTFALPVTGGSYDPASRTGSVTSKGGFRIGYVLFPADAQGAHGIWVTLGNVAVRFDGATGTLTATSESGFHDTPVVAMASRTIATLDLSTPPTASADGSTLTWTAIPATIAAGGQELVQSFRDAPGRPSLGDVREIDPVTITLQLR